MHKMNMEMKKLTNSLTFPYGIPDIFLRSAYIFQIDAQQIWDKRDILFSPAIEVIWKVPLQTETLIFPSNL